MSLEPRTKCPGLRSVLRFMNNSEIKAVGRETRFGVCSDGVLVTVRSFKELIAIGLVLSISKSAAFDHPTSQVLRQGGGVPVSFSAACVLGLVLSIMTHLGLIKPWMTWAFPRCKRKNNSRSITSRKGPGTDHNMLDGGAVTGGRRDSRYATQFRSWRQTCR